MTKKTTKNPVRNQPKKLNAEETIRMMRSHMVNVAPTNSVKMVRRLRGYSN